MRKMGFRARITQMVLIFYLLYLDAVSSFLGLKTDVRGVMGRGSERSGLI